VRNELNQTVRLYQCEKVIRDKAFLGQLSGQLLA
jgi:hypothetical protein